MGCFQVDAVVVVVFWGKTLEIVGLVFGSKYGDCLFGGQRMTLGET